jgi:antitoxin component YwqK of YwqJK toxin-antitoxin module
MEAVFDRGVLTGIKTRWWKNGQIREEEYWDGGNYRGKKSWDDRGRVIKEERVR